MKIKKEFIDMNKILITVICSLLLLTACSNEPSGIADCVNSYHSNADYHLTIIANRYEIDNKEEYALQLLEQVKNNDFQSIMFSYDLTGYPTGLEMDVYLTEKDKENHDLFMNISFQQENLVDGYNIVDNYNKFTLEIR